MKAVAAVLPFRVNSYVVDTLIDWSRAPDDPIFQLVFPHRDMLPPADFATMRALLAAGAEPAALEQAARAIRARLNPHPAGQLERNNPVATDGRPIRGLQHKYAETVLFFPSEGQTCHSFCAFCFRWPQFTKDKSLRMALSDRDALRAYLAAHQEVTDLLVTGGDPLVMKARRLRHYLEILREPALDHVRSVRIGSKALSFWPYRFVRDDDADDLLALFAELRGWGKHVTLMAHINHKRELEPAVARQAIARLQAAGVVIRSQSPVLRHVNDSAEAWAALWTEQVRLGIVPYYMFVPRDTGAKSRFDVPLVRAYQIYRDAIARVSGLARTARGPSMSTEQGKVEVQGIADVSGEKLFVLRFIQARDPDWVQRPFFARYDEKATWFDELELIGAPGEARGADASRRARAPLPAA